MLHAPFAGLSVVTGRSLFRRLIGKLLTGALLLCLGSKLLGAPLDLVEAPADGGLSTALINETFDGIGASFADEWSFEAEAGDRLSVRVEAAIGNSRPRLRLVNTSNATLQSINGGTDGLATFEDFEITTPGTYLIRVYTDHQVGDYAVHVHAARGVNLESEDNDTPTTADRPGADPAAGSFGFATGGLLTTGDLGDTFALGAVSAGANITAEADLTSSALSPETVTLRLFESRLADRAVDFNGSTFLTVPHDPVFDAIETDRAVTIEGWVYIRSWPQSYFNIFDKYSTDGDQGWGLSIQSSGGGISFWSTRTARVSSNVVPSVNVWHHVAATYDHAANEVRFYLDGQLVSTGASPGPLFDTVDTPLYIGHGPTGSTNEYNNGRISELRLWNRALTTAEIEASYAAIDLEGNESGLVGLWRFDEGSGETAGDASASGLHATLGGGDPARIPSWASGLVRPIHSVDGTAIEHTFADNADIWIQIAASANQGLAARYHLSGNVTDTKPLHVLSTNLPSAGGSTTEYLQAVTINFDDELDVPSANDLSHFELRNAGLDGAFGTGDDFVYEFEPPGYTAGRELSLRLVNGGPIQTGLHRLTIGVGVRDRAGNALTATYQNDFTIEQLGIFVFKGLNDNSFATATSLDPMPTDGDGRIGGARGRRYTNNDDDYYSFTLEAGDHVFIATESVNHSSSTGLRYRVYGPNQSQIGTDTSNNGSSQIQFVATASGIHYLRAESYYDYRGEYRFVVSSQPASSELESETNDARTSADVVNWTIDGSVRTAAIAGVMVYNDPADWFDLGFIDVGTDIEAHVSRPASSELEWIIEIVNEAGTTVISTAPGEALLTYTVPSEGAGRYYVRLLPVQGRGLLSRYHLSLSASDTQSPQVVGTTLPAAGSTATGLITDFSLTFSEGMMSSTVNDVSNYQLTAAGPDEAFDTPDDESYSVTLVSSYSSGITANYRIADGPLQPGTYRFVAGTGLQDQSGNSAVAFTHTFAVAGVEGFVAESRQNGSFATADSLMPLTPDGAGFVGAARGHLSSGNDDDYFSFDVVAGDRVIVGTESMGSASGTGLRYRVYGPNQSQITTVTSSNGTSQAQFVASATGTHYVRVEQYYGYFGEYRFFVAVQPGEFDLESENNNSAGNANALTWTSGVGIRTASVGGVLDRNDTGSSVGDWYQFGYLDVGTHISLSADKPASSNVTWILEILEGNSVVAAADAGAAQLEFTVPEGHAATYYARVRVSSGEGLFAQYRLSLTLADTTAPSVVSSTLPAEGSAVSDFYSVFDLAFSESLNAATVSDFGNYDLRAAGPDEAFDTADDRVYTLAMAATYTSGVTAHYRVIDNPLQPDTYRFEARTGLTDLYGNPLASVFTQTFTIVDVDGYVLESTDNHSFATATSLGELTPDGDSFIGRGRGHLESNSVEDYFSFVALAGDRVIVATQSFPNPRSQTGLNYRIYNPARGQVVSITSNDGSSQATFVAPADGVYYVRVEDYYGYYGEYRFSVAVHPADGDIESENNDSTGSADPLNWTTAPGLRSTNVVGVLHAGDPSDWFALGSLSEATEINLDVSAPPSSGLVWIAEVMNATGTAVAATAPAGTELTYAVPENQAGTHYVRIRPASGADLMGQYRIGITLSDTRAPVVVSNTLPQEGTSTENLLHRLTLTFSKDMEAATVNDLANYELLAAGPDGEFDTADDVTVPLVMLSTYSSGVTASLRVADTAPLPVGLYRFKALPGLMDRSGNALSPVHLRHFEVTQVPGYIHELEPNSNTATATALELVEALPGLLGTGGRGYLFNGNETDVWGFDLQEGDRVAVLGDSIDGTSQAGLTYRINRPDGTSIQSLNSGSSGTFAFNPFIAPQSGRYTLQVTQWYAYSGEYRFRIQVLREGIQVESETNDTIGAANPVTLTVNGDQRSASVAGLARTSGDLDYFHLGTLSAGTTVFLSTRQPAYSTFVPVVSLYTATGALQPENAGGRSGDGVAQVNLSVTGEYYALVRTSGLTFGVASEYVLDVLVVPTSDISYPNLQVTSLTPPPASGLKSGDATTISFRVDNLGNLATGAVSWIDRVVLSTDPLYSTDDLELAVFPRSGPLVAGSHYLVSNAPITLPDGISGSFYVIVRTDHSNTVPEFILEGDNETVSDVPIIIARADYPDLVIEDLAVSEPDTVGVRTATWTLANRGVGPARIGHVERIQIRNTSTGSTLLNRLEEIESVLPPGGTVLRQAEFTAVAAGDYSVQVTADVQSDQYEENAAGHDDAEANNQATVGFSIIKLHELVVEADPAAGGTVSGGGTFPAGTARTVTATPNSPYLFTGWFENSLLRSVNPEYTSVLQSDRVLTARFALPSVLISATAEPAGTGIVTGGGTHTVGSTVTLVAQPLPGYVFAFWTEGGVELGNAQPLVFPAATNRSLRAHFIEANPTHVVTTATLPEGVATVSGAGVYPNGSVATIAAPTPVTSGDTEYVFVRLLLNGTPISSNPTLQKTLSTQDPPALAYVAEYEARSLKPSVVQVTTNSGTRVGRTGGFQVTVQFDRAMNTAIRPVVALVSADAEAVPAVPPAGVWTTSTTYVTPGITIGDNHGGGYLVQISAAQDQQTRVMDPVELFPFTIDVEAPALPELTTTDGTASSVTVAWEGYAAPADLASFRVYRSASNFTSLAGLSPIGSLAASARDYTFSGLAIDTDYYVAVVPVDSVGNAVATVTPHLIRVASELPPEVAFEVLAPTTSSAQIVWTFDPADVVGFRGFRVYRHSEAFTSIEGLTPLATLDADARSLDDPGLDRAQTYHYAVVGYNNLDESRTAVTSKPWQDPLSGTLTTDFTVAEPLLIIHEPLTVSGGATLTVPAGTVVAFAPDAGLTIESGRLVAEGTVFAPVIFTSLADVENAGPTQGSWNGITLADAGNASTLRHVWINYGMGLAIAGGNHTVDTLGAAWNALAGLHLTGPVALTTTSAYLVNNVVGASVEDGASLTISGSVIKNNGTNAAIAGAGSLIASQNWWGTADAGAIASGLSGAVVAGNPLAGEPVLTQGLRSADGAVITGSASPTLLFASLNATGYRVSEDSSFSGALFLEVPRDPLSANLFNTTAWTAPVELSPGAGVKTLYAQFRSPTGTLSETVSFELDYVTTGPVLSTFSLTEGQTLQRPMVVSGSATSHLPLASLTLSVDDVVIAQSPTGSLSTLWDIRSVTPGVHRVRLAAQDTAGQLATRTVNVIVAPTPPAAPVITSPLTETSTTSALIAVSGTAEPQASVRIHRNGAVVATATADASGAFTASGVALVEGVNQLTAVAFDSIGATPSTVVTVYVDSGPPAAVTLLPLVYNVGEGVFVDWDLPVAGEVPTSYRVYWHNAPFTSASEATGSSDLLASTHTLMTALPDGLHYFGVVGYDSVGNASALSNVRSFHVDLTPPTFAIAYNRTMPVGPGDLGITVTASEPLAEPPLVLMRPQGGALLSIPLTPGGGMTYTATFPVTNLSARTGIAGIGITGTDLAGNTFTGAPIGPDLVFDLTKPTGVVVLDRESPIQTTADVALTVTLTLSEPARSGTEPTLAFSPPTGPQVPLALAGNGVNWVGQLTVTPAMGDGNGTFLLQVQDEVGNAGTVLTSGEHLELYTGETPTPTAAPGTFTVQPLAGGFIRLTWSAVDKAHSYRVYRDPGAGAAPPTTLVAEGIEALSYDDLPPADGQYRYVVTAFRLGAESAPSGVRATTSDRTPPPAPATTTATLGVSGIDVEWTPGDGETPARWFIYRNGARIATVSNPAATRFVDSPPRGVMSYTVAAADALGNEASGPQASIELHVGAVSQLLATVDPETGTTLSWMSSDATTAGYNVYRNGTLLTGTPINVPFFTDTLNAGGQPVSYLVTAVNAGGQESAARGVLVQPLTMTLRLNPSGDDDLASVARYFDRYEISYTLGAAASQPVAFSEGEIIRTVAAETPVQVLFPVPEISVPGSSETATAIVPAANVVGAVQGVVATLRTEPDAGGSRVEYQIIDDFVGAEAAGLMMSLSTTAPPLAGGVSDFKARVYNRGYAAMDLVLSRGGGAQPGELKLLILNDQGVLVATAPFTGSVAGSIINAQGDAFLRIEPGSHADIVFNDVLVPEGVGGQTLTFRARAQHIYHAVGSSLERVNGPLEGSTTSSTTVTPYYANAQTTQPAYSDSDPITIFGQALDRVTNQPVPNVKVRVGLRVRGAVLSYEVFTDDTGSYELEYTPTPGLAGEIMIWAAHPDIVDQLDQTRVVFYRLYTRPGRIEAVMTKNDTLDFDVALLNPADLTLTSPSVSFRAFRVEDGSEVDVPGLTGAAQSIPATIAPRAEPRLRLRLQATLDVPDDALFEFTISTAEGASTKLTGTVSFRPALAVLTTVSPTHGYAEAGVGRGQLKSVEVTVQNRGLRDLTGVRLVGPAGVPWMHVNLAPDGSGQYPMADIPIGGVRTFSVIFAPPEDTPVGFYNDFLLIQGDNAVGDYRLNLFATVTSEEKGSVLFDVTNTFGQPVPNSSIWLRNTTLGNEVGPLQTDVNGQVLVPDLMEGEWQWKTQTAGHGATQGVVTVIPDQTVSVETEIMVSMVTVKFSVVPVPFTDYYEIKIEQTFQTRTPIPNLVMSPPHQTLSVEPGWSGTLMYTLRNEGLRSIFDVNIDGNSFPTMRATPMVSFLPELKAQETVEIPVFFEYFGPRETDLEEEGGSGGAGFRALSTGFGEKSAKGGAKAMAMASSSRSASGGISTMGIGDSIDEFLDCYEEFKYGTITLKAAGGISSVSGKPYTVGVNATIDVDELLALFCDGECPERLTGGGIVGYACGKLVGKVVEQISKKTKVIDVVCKASNIIKALACAAAQLPTGQVRGGGPGGGGGGGGAVGGPGYPGGWSVIGSGCFVAGTPVTLADGSIRPIEQIGQGDRLLASPNGRADAVAQVVFLNSDHVRELSFRLKDDASAPLAQLRLTHDHRVWVDGQGWTFASAVKPGDWLHGSDGRLREVVANNRLPGHHDVYGLHMGSDNVIYASGVLTEDQCFQDIPTFRAAPQMGGVR